VAVIGGSVSLAKLGGNDVMTVVAALITITSTFSLVFGLSDRARRHASLAADFRRLEAEILAKGERDFTEADIGSWASRERVLEASEPPSLGNLVRICQNELAVAQSHPENIRKVGFWRHLFAHWLDLPMLKAPASS